MPSFAIPKFTVLLEPLWVPAEFLLLSTGPIAYCKWECKYFQQENGKKDFFGRRMLILRKKSVILKARRSRSASLAGI